VGRACRRTVTDVMPGAPTKRIAPQRISELLRGLVPVSPDQDRDVRGLTLDSREVKPGDLFVAVPGNAADGRRFVQDAVSRGAMAVLCENGEYQFPHVTVPLLRVPDLRPLVGIIADRFFGAPSKRLIVIGVTGTNGKTTCAHLLAQVLDVVPTRCALIGTLGSGFPHALDAAALTTPDAVTVHRLLAQFLQAGATHVSMEVSSHALAQARTTAVAFDIAIFTNLSRDHLDYHVDMESYGLAKARLFEIESLKTAIINRDDPFGRALAERVRSRIETITYGINEGEVHARELHARHDGLEFEAVTPQGAVELRCPLYGRFNASNLLAVLAALLACGVELETAGARLCQVKPVLGRTERFGGQSGTPLVVVDYAHTPDALEQVLRALREHVQARLFCLFGCGGERDRGKRPQMGRVAEQLADVVVLTDDNPRNEPGDQIIADIVAGMRTRARVMRDRTEAIRTVIGEAGQDDVVLIAGKGHEQYQYVGDARLPYSDRETVCTILGEAA
jgi:UDP-N-acetylmuramoyl-L-alanyl-D-glutamate--2,6-diaminopimelate ligase